MLGLKMKKKDGSTFKIKWDWLGVVFAIAGIALNSQKMILCWPAYMISNIFMALHFAPKKEYPFLLLLAAYFVLNIFAWYSWAISA